MTSTARSRFPWYLLLACAVVCVAMSSQSFWIDEIQTAQKAAPPALGGWWHALYGEGSSNMQLPLYMLYIWGWARLFHVSELWLRAGNIPWFFLGLYAIRHFLRRRTALRDAALLLYCLHPFVWYYLDEARPYLMQLSGALLVAGCLFAALDEGDEAFTSSWWWLYAAGVTILCGAGLLGVPWAIALSLPLAGMREFWQSCTRAGRAALLVFGPVLIVLALYLGWTIERRIGTGILNMSIPSMLAVPYEQLGFLGLGPGRNVLRVVSLPALRPFLVPVALLGLPLGWGLLLAARERFGLSARQLRLVLLLTLSPVALIFALGFVRHARILARHLTPLFPFILIAQAYAVMALWKSGSLLNRAAAVLIVVALTVSSLEVRFAFRHSKDDFRSAAAAATQALAEGKTVWWAAGEEGRFYDLPMQHGEAPGFARWVQEVPARYTAPPDQIYLSKPDLDDPTGTISAYIAANHYRPAATWQAFTLWEAPPRQPPPPAPAASGPPGNPPASTGPRIPPP